MGLTGLVLEVFQLPEYGILLREEETGKVLRVAQLEAFVAASQRMTSTLCW